MPVNTVTVATAVTPTVMHTYMSHYLNRKPLREKPTAHISYHEGLELIRRFLHFASFHTVEELQAFTSQWVPVPHWVHVKEVEIPSAMLARSASYIQEQLGPGGVAQVGGKTWWQWRRDNTALKAEWIEMKKDHDDRKRAGKLANPSGDGKVDDSNNGKGRRIMLYVHGGAYYFGSVDEHRYQMQRHARKLKARVFAPRYRLSPQFPFPCGLHDCLAAYLYLLEEKHEPSTIILAGDSAGGGMVLSLLVTLRDQGVPLPAGAILISPWVDLTHSFPSLGGDGKQDYIPAHGFVHKPSLSWPPPNADDILDFERSPRGSQQEKKLSNGSQTKGDETKHAEKEVRIDRVRGFSVNEQGVEGEAHPTAGSDEFFISADGKYSIGPKSNPVLSVQLDGSRIEIKDQIQMYAPNHLLTHPLVSPVLQPTLGGLPPLLIQTGGGELLHDEQVYLAHKAAQPLAFLPPISNHQTAEAIQAQAAKYRPTNVQLQVWDDLCHVAPTLSFTRPAKHMYRSIAQFGAWALARAQKTSIDILDDDSISFVSHGSSESSDNTGSDREPSSADIKLTMSQSAQHVGFESVRDKSKGAGDRVGKAGDSLPPFENHMIRQRIDRHGYVYALAPKEQLVALNIPAIEIGVPKPGPVTKWMRAQKQWNGKFAKQKLKVQKKRLKDMQTGYEMFEGERPPPTALAGRRVKGMKAEKSKKKSWGMALWSLWGSKHDEATLDREERADSTDHPRPDEKPTKTDAAEDKASSKDRKKSGLKPASRGEASRSRSRSRVANVTDKGQVAPSMEDLNRLAPPTSGLAEATKCAPERKASPLPSPTSETGSLGASGGLAPDITVSRPQSPLTPTLIPETDGTSTRPTRGGIAYPFSLRVEGTDQDANPSMVTLQSVVVKEGEGLAPEIDAKPASAEEIAASTDEASGSERPGVQRFVTAGAGELMNESAKEKNAERPGVERFETAQEDLTTLANGTK